MLEQNNGGQGYHYQPIPQPNPVFSYGTMPVPKQNSHNGRIALISILAALGIIIIGVLLFVIGAGTGRMDDQKTPKQGSIVESDFGNEQDVAQAPSVKADPNAPQFAPVETEQSASAETTVATKVYEKAYRSIVCITSYDKKKDYITSADGEGSGIILTADGYIATNSHVINDSKKTGVMVSTHDKKQYLATIIGLDQKTDLAVLKIDAKALEPVEFADSDQLAIGELCFALGNPGGSEFSHSLTKGAVSALDRTLSGSAHTKYIQTDAAINPGNSGGALLNEFGQVIGINTAKLVATDYEGMGFAIPSNTVVEIVNKLIKYGYVNDRGTIGIEGKTCDLYMSKVNNVPQGMLVTKIDPKGSAASTELKVNDIITQINGTEVKSSYELIDELKKYRPDDKVKLKIFRPAKEKGQKGYSFDIEVILKSDTGSENK